MKTKKSQMKIQQMAFMIIALTVFLALAGLMIVAVRFADIKDSASLLREKNAQLLAVKIANTPELSCGKGFNLGGTKSNCIDFDKVMMLKQKIDKFKNVGTGNSEDNFWGRGVTNIEIRKVFPVENSSGVDKECTIGTYPNCDVIRLLSGEIIGTPTISFVSLCRKESEEREVYDKCEIAKIIVSYDKVN